MFYSDTSRDNAGPETLHIEVDGLARHIQIELAARAGDDGHEGLGSIEGRLADDCSFVLRGMGPFRSAGGNDFGVITVEWSGRYPEGGRFFATMSMQGGGIPSGPIFFDVQFAPGERG